jgi:hypothetical protein
MWMKPIRSTVMVAALALAGFTSARSQESAQQKEREKAHEALTLKIIADGKEAPARQHIVLEEGLTSHAGTAMFVASEIGFEGKVVRGIPYSARAVSETTQTLADGNRIVRRTETALFRDSEGRTRREQSLGAIGPWAAAQPEHRTILVRDPVAEQSFMLDPERRVAHKHPPMSAFGGLRAKIEMEKAHEKTHASATLAGGEPRAAFAFYRPLGESRKESLGIKLMEGVQAEGTRITTTIPAGEIGNERPIEIVSESWYSPELEMTILTRHYDPRAGETLYRLTDIRREEPDASLFQIPAGYDVFEAPMRFDVKLKKDE